MKKTTRFLLFTLVLSLACLLCLGQSLADVGNFNSYSGGSSGSSSSGGFFFLPIGGGFGLLVMVALVILVQVLRRHQGASPASPMQQRPSYAPVVDHTQKITEAILLVDPNFSSAKFIAWSKEVFITMQMAWMAREWEKIRPFESDRLFRQHEMQLNEYIQNGQVNVIERINISQAYLSRYQRTKEYETLTVFLDVRMTDYIKEEASGRVLKGDPNTDSFLQYLLTFQRKRGVQTDPAQEEASVLSCPHCGAPVSMDKSGKCEYCGFAISGGEGGWVLNDMTAPTGNVDNSGVLIQE